MTAVAYNTFGFKSDKDGYEHAVTAIKDHAKMLDKALEGKSWLVGGTFTLADVVVFNSFIVPFSFVLDAGFRKACLPNFSAYFERISRMPVIARSSGYVKMCEKALKPQF
jgi:glutathione S-transferase